MTWSGNNPGRYRAKTLRAPSSESERPPKPDISLRAVSAAGARYLLVFDGKDGMQKGVKTARSERQVTQVFGELSTLCAQRYGPDGGMPAPSAWPKTRDIADICDISIYLSRIVLLVLVDRGKVQVTAHSINNSLRWFIIENKGVRSEGTE